MTWKQLADEIALMPPGDQAKEVLYCEHYQDFSVMPVDGPVIADERLEGDNDVTVEAGEYYLA